MAVLSEDFKKVREIADKTETDGLINYLLTILNIKASSSEEAHDLKIQMMVVDDFIKTKFGYLTIPEIREAFKMYVAREFSHIKVFRILDCPSIGEVLQAYTDFRAENLRTYSQQKTSLLQASREPSDEQKQKIREQFLKVIFDELVEKSYSYDSWMLFLELEKSGKLIVSVEEKKALYNRELSKYIPKHQDEIRHRNPHGASKLIEEFKNKTKSGQLVSAVQNNCRSILASNFLKDYTKDFEIFKKLFE